MIEEGLRGGGGISQTRKVQETGLFCDDRSKQVEDLRWYCRKSLYGGELERQWATVLTQR